MPKRPRAIDLWTAPVYSNLQEGDDEVEETKEPEPPRATHAESAEEESSGGEEVDEGVSDEDTGLNPTCVTPFVALLSRRFFRGLRVAGPQHVVQSADTITKELLLRSQEYSDYMAWLVSIVHSGASTIRFDEPHVFHYRSNWYKAVTINSVLINVGDVVIVAAGKKDRSEFPEQVLPERNSTTIFAGDYFWFARILAIKRDDYTAHVQWFEHGCKTILEEMAHPQELFLTNECSNIKLEAVLAVCRLRRVNVGERPGSLMHDEFFYSLSYIKEASIFREISPLENNPLGSEGKPDCCGLCAAKNEVADRDNESYSPLSERDGSVSGLEKQGVIYHLWDTVFIRTKEVCDVGQIVQFSRDFADITLKLFGRVNDIVRREKGLHASIYEDRHLFLTEEELHISPSDLICKCFIAHGKQVASIDEWLASSTRHFYVTDRAPLLKHASPSSLSPLPLKDLSSCFGCMTAESKETANFADWGREKRDQPLRLFDPFAGVGAFALGMCLSGTMKLTHAIEICPSSAKTLKENSPDTIVYNQCSNKMLESASISERGRTEANGGNHPPLPRRDEIDCIVSGFPCQPHSSLNMFQKAHDLRNELFLNAISWVDHLRPKFVLFENVEGFVSHRINAIQKDRHTVMGGIEQGGIKFLVRALISMGYQVRFGLLQAAHYGTPQSRVRFFLWAAQSGHILPEFPEPTHDFPRTIKMPIKFKHSVVAPIKSGRGMQPLPFVTVRDAISDLTPWDWRNPHKMYKKSRRELSGRREFLQIEVNKGDRECGLTGSIPYEHCPRTYFQARCRRQSTENIQHITPCFKDEIVESVVNILLSKGSDYGNLYDKPLLWEYQTMAATSANGRKGYRTPSYARLDADGYFNTVVTNVGGTAKQSKVLHPWCKRIVTVRELARAQGFPDSFVFYALDERVRTMHRQIGNAVPWPLSEALGRELEKAVLITDLANKRKHEQDRKSQL